jgi:hypothetical protein
VIWGGVCLGLRWWCRFFFFLFVTFTIIDADAKQASARHRFAPGCQQRLTSGPSVGLVRRLAFDLVTPTCLCWFVFSCFPFELLGVFLL